MKCMLIETHDFLRNYYFLFEIRETSSICRFVIYVFRKPFKSMSWILLGRTVVSNSKTHSESISPKFLELILIIRKSSNLDTISKVQQTFCAVVVTVSNLLTNYCYYNYHYHYYYFYPYQESGFLRHIYTI